MPHPTPANRGSHGVSGLSWALLQASGLAQDREVRCPWEAWPCVQTISIGSEGPLGGHTLHFYWPSGVGGGESGTPEAALVHWSPEQAAARGLKGSPRHLSGQSLSLTEHHPPGFRTPPGFRRLLCQPQAGSAPTRFSLQPHGGVSQKAVTEGCELGWSLKGWQSHSGSSLQTGCDVTFEQDQSGCLNLPSRSS